MPSTLPRTCTRGATPNGAPVLTLPLRRSEAVLPPSGSAQTAVAALNIPTATVLPPRGSAQTVTVRAGAEHASSRAACREACSVRPQGPPPQSRVEAVRHRAGSIHPLVAWFRELTEALKCLGHGGTAAKSRIGFVAGAAQGILCALLLGIAPPLPAFGAEQPSVCLPLGPFVTSEDAARIASGAAWLEALRHEARQRTDTMTRLAAYDVRQRQILLAASLIPQWHPSPAFPVPAGQPQPANICVRVSFDGTPQEQDTALRTALQCPERLRLQEHIVTRLQHLRTQAEAQARASVDASKAGKITQAQTAGEEAAALGQRMEALRQLQTLLPRLCSLWEKADDTATLLRRALDMDDENSLLWCALGETALQQDTPTQALQYMENALDHDPAYAPARAGQSLAHLRLGQPALAESAITTALQTAPRYAPWLRVRGAIRMILGKHEEMCADFILACEHGDCSGLQEARKRQLCLPAAASPSTTDADTAPGKDEAPKKPTTGTPAGNTVNDAVTAPTPHAPATDQPTTGNTAAPVRKPEAQGKADTSAHNDAGKPLDTDASPNADTAATAPPKKRPETDGVSQSRPTTANATGNGADKNVDKPTGTDAPSPTPHEPAL